jgi:lipoprotein-anchoring transpeptidase ErfK/SrfK
LNVQTIPGQYIMNRRIFSVLTASVATGALLALGTGATELHATSASARTLGNGDPRVEVSLSARQVSLYRGSERVATYRIGVGQPDWPVQTGEWHIYQIDFNPDWTPPQDEEWSEDREYKEAGHPDNPMGRVRMRYDPPRSIHGTDDEDSIGRAESHGSIRIRNQDGIELARLLMESSGDTRSESWWEETLGNESEMVTVELSNPIPIRVRDE